MVASPAAIEAQDSRCPALPPMIYLFGSHNEDARVELAALQAVLAARRHAERLRVLSVSSCGSHAIAMCSVPEVATVDSVDMSPGQVMLSRLSAAAAGTLPTVEAFGAFLNGDGGGDALTAAYRSAVRPALSAETAAFWDAKLDTISSGLLRCGGNERVYCEVREALTERVPAWASAPTPRAAVELLAQHPEDVLAAAQLMVNAVRYMPAGIPPPVIELITSTLKRYFPSRFAEHVAKFGEEGASLPVDVTLHTILTGRYAVGGTSGTDGSHGIPPAFLLPEVFQAAQRNGCLEPRLRFLVGKLHEVGAELAAQGGGPFDLIDMSNILDMARREDMDAMAASLKALLRPDGGALLGRFAGEPGLLAACFERSGLRVDAAESARLLDLESSFVMKEVCLAWR